MSITAERRTALIGEYQAGPTDTGSPEVQVGCGDSDQRSAISDKLSARSAFVLMTESCSLTADDAADRTGNQRRPN
jgi:hypothetical protein